MATQIEVDLITRSLAPVATVLIAPFKEMPDVILWGDRAFTKWAHSEPDNWIYREAFAVAALKTKEAGV